MVAKAALELIPKSFIDTATASSKKFVEANGDWMATHRVDLSTMEESSWTSSPND